MKAGNRILNILKAFILPVVLWLLFVVITKGEFASTTIFMSTLRTAVGPMLLALSLAVGMQMGMLNFAVSTVAYAAIIIGWYISSLLGWGVWGMCLFCMIVSVLIMGAIGILYNLLRINSIILTLGLLIVLEAFPIIVVPNGTATLNLLDCFLGLSPWCFIIVAVFFAIFYVVNELTTFGANMKAIGASVSIANSAGINIDRVKFISFLFSGIFSAAAGIIYISTDAKIVGSVGFGTTGILFDALMGVFIALVLTRYINFGAAVLIGTFTIRLLTTGLVSTGVSAEVRGILTGVFLFAVMAYSANSNILEIMRNRKKVIAEATEAAKEA